MVDGYYGYIPKTATNATIITITNAPPTPHPIAVVRDCDSVVTIIMWRGKQCRHNIVDFFLPVEDGTVITGRDGYEENCGIMEEHCGYIMDEDCISHGSETLVTVAGFATHVDKDSSSQTITFPEQTAISE